MAATSQPGTEQEALKRLSLCELIDHLGEADRAFRLWSPQINPHAARRAMLLAELDRRYTKFPAEKTDLQKGTAYQLEVTRREIRREVTLKVKQAAWRAFQKAKKKPLEIFDVTLKALTLGLGEAWVKKYVAEPRTGPRAYNITPLAPAEEVEYKEAA